MKVLAVLVLCAFAAVQGRSAGVSNNKNLAALGENPWHVHLRIARATNDGFLDTCTGSLISSRWVLTTADCVKDVRFVWVRYGALNVINPSLVTETSSARTKDDLALLDINREVSTTDNIAPVSLGLSDDVSLGRFCSYGENEAGGPGESLSCFDAQVEPSEGYLIATSDDGAASRFDEGAALIADEIQVGVLVKAGDDTTSGTFVPLTAEYLEWIAGEIAPEVSSEESESSESESSESESSESSESESSEESEKPEEVKVKFVN